MNWRNLSKAFAIVFGVVLLAIIFATALLHIDTWGKYVMLVLLVLLFVALVYFKLEYGDDD